ncbi:hypothetical protein BKA62DRAFT_705491 [Auriculariales sp. MPI-PUGE-AT-0066]|nr:hypothetical protein BKA62DRAFT_705491 [Auriculariales sp. MPI-PUGE-AT-0066]
MHVVPDDILYLLFDALAFGSPWPWPEAKYDQERSRVPFVLSALCRHWRHAARATPSLRTYLGFPTSPSEPVIRAQLDRLQLIRSMSMDQPVDIVLQFGMAYTVRNDGGIRSQYFDVIIAVLNDVASRWRNVALKIPQNFAFGLESALRGECPRLISLSIYFRDLKRLPRTPSLDRLAVMCSLELVHDGIHLPSLTTLAMEKQRDPVVYEQQIVATYASLLDLGIFDFCKPGSVKLLELPCLTSLTL